MWEDGSPKVAVKSATPTAAQRESHTVVKSSTNLVLWVQLALCVGVLCALYGLRTMQVPFYAALRTAVQNQLNAQAWYTGDEERDLLKFTQQSVFELKNAITEVLATLDGEPITAEEGARPAQQKAVAAVRRQGIHGKSLPFGYSEAAYQPFTGMVFPLDVGGCNVNSGYGWRTNPLTGAQGEYHGGVDLAARTGSTVHAAAAGIVRFAGTHDSYGNYIRIFHQDGTETLYAHMQYLFVRSGKRVAAGEPLGTVGQTGDATGPHLHFEILCKGVRYDPTQALQQALESATE